MVHCLATKNEWAVGKRIREIVKEVRGWHIKGRGWSDIAYAVILGVHGGRGLGRDLDKDGDVWEETGAGARGWNKNGIHLALVGGYYSKETDPFLKNYTAQQEQALLKEIRNISTMSGRTIVPIRDLAQIRKLKKTEIGLLGHNQVDAKACPGFNVPDWWDSHQVKIKAPSSSLPRWLQRLLKGDFS